MKMPESKIDYTLRESRRAKRVILRVGVNGLEVVIPTRFGKRRLPEIIQANREWIEKELREIEESPPIVAPDYINLISIGDLWKIDYQPLSPSSAKSSVKENSPNQLLVEGDANDIKGVSSVLTKWLHQKAQAHLIPWIKEVSREVGISFRNSTVRGQATRWASCSQTGNISLNRSLLFLPKRLVRHVFLHELCHIKEPNHAPEFWKLFSRLEPDCQHLESEVRKANGYLPGWALLH